MLVIVFIFKFILPVYINNLTLLSLVGASDVSSATSNFIKYRDEGCDECLKIMETARENGHKLTSVLLSTLNDNLSKEIKDSLSRELIEEQRSFTDLKHVFFSEPISYYGHDVEQLRNLSEEQKITLLERLRQ
ncbi:MAG: hypothetical protein QM504_06565 [Pseudomonadota bacterium]